MNIYCKLLTGAAAIAGIAAPAAAQTYYPAQPQAYPQTNYPQGYAYPQAGYPQAGYPQPGYGYPQQQSGVAGIINQLLGNRYNVTDRTRVAQCATAAQAQAAHQYRSRAAYGQQRGAYQGAPYGNAYGYHAMQSARVTAVTNVERRANGMLRVSGLMNSGTTAAYAHPGYNHQGYAPQGYGQQGYNPAYAQAGSDLSFRCNVDHRGAVTNVRVNRTAAYRR